MSLKIQKVSINSIKLNQKNPRKISKEALERLKKSLQGFPEMIQIRPIVIDKKNTIIGGNMRYTAAKSLGWKEISVIRAETLTPAQIKEFIIRDNVEFGEWDIDELKEWNHDKLSDWGFTVPYYGHDVNSMSEDGLDITEEFDVIGKSKGLQRVVFIFDNAKQAEEYLKKLGDIPLKKFNNAWHVNLSSQSI